MISIMFIIIPIFSLLFMIMVFVLIFSPKARSKFMSNQIKAQKEVLKYSENDLKEISDMKANIDKGYYKNIAGAVKEGLTENNIYCKYCGESIDGDSEFCKYCGKEQ